MKVAILLPQINAAQSAVWDAAAARGVELTLLGPEEALEPYFQAEGLPTDTRTIILRANRFGPWRGNRWTWYSGLLRALQELEPDVIHVASELWGLPVLQASFSAVPLVAHGADNSFWFGSGLRKWSRIAGIRLNLKNISGYASWNGAGVELAKRAGLSPSCPTLVAPPMTPRRPWAQKLDRDWRPVRFKILYLGRMTAEKGFSDLVQAIGSRVELRDRVKLVAVGVGPERFALNQLRAEEFECYEQIEHGSVAALMAECHVCVIPSRTLPTVAEQFSRVAVEAMSTGLPLIATNVGALSEVLGDAGIVVEERCPKEIAGALLDLVDDPDKLEQLSCRGLDRYQSMYTPEVLAQKYEGFWREVMEFAEQAR